MLFSDIPPELNLTGVVVEIINTGSELMLGRVLNTHQQWLCRQLADRGYIVDRQTAVPDRGEDIKRAVQEALPRADLIITTGGLGPTSDDITRDFIAQLFGAPLREDPAVLAHVESFFRSRGRPMPVRTRLQAQVPEGALVLPNPNGTAPGLALRTTLAGSQRNVWLIMLPGPPRELRPMFLDTVVPLLRRELPLPADFVCVTLKTTGIGESMVEEKIDGPLSGLVARGLDLGYCARPGQVDVRLAARVNGAAEVVNEAESIVRSLLKAHIYGAEDQDLESQVVTLLTEQRSTLALAESCTGGHIANLLTNVPGASAALSAGVVTYSNEAKQALLGVKSQSLSEHGAVSETVACEMAAGVRLKTGATFGLSVTGIAGPGGGTDLKPVGTVYIGLATEKGVRAIRNFNPYDRATFKQVTAQQALELLRQELVRP